MPQRYKAVVFVSEKDRYPFSMQKVHDVESLRSLRRDFVCGEHGVTVSDSYVFTEKPESVVELFVSLAPIVERDGGFVCNGFTLSYDADVLDASLSSEDMTNKNGKAVTVYILDLTVKKL